MGLFATVVRCHRGIQLRVPGISAVNARAAGTGGTIDGFVAATIAPGELQPTSAPAARTIDSVPARMIGIILMIQSECAICA
jgi:hypothetical protein